MQSLRAATNGAVTAPACAGALLDAVPPVMRFIRSQMRRHRGRRLSVPQFRALVFLSRHPGGSLSALAAQLGLSPAAVSRLVDGLVAAGMVVRADGEADRRRVALTLTPRGRMRYRSANEATRRELARALAGLSGGERGRLCAALALVRAVFAPGESGAREDRP